MLGRRDIQWLGAYLYGGAGTGQVDEWRTVECDWVAGGLSIDAGEDEEVAEVASG
jgi:hypothetical protein